MKGIASFLETCFTEEERAKARLLVTCAYGNKITEEQAMLILAGMGLQKPINMLNLNTTS